MLRAPGLKTAGRFFAFSSKGALVVKLPTTRVDELIVKGEGQPCSPGRGRAMREWVRLAPTVEEACVAYMVEARNFVAAQGDR